jgi:glycerol-3-phosphate acyltransferase PlsX
MGRLGGISRPALAVVVPSLAGPVVLVDAGAAPDATPDVLRQFALAGWAYSTSLGVEHPRVGLLTIGSEEGKGDRLRKSTHDLLQETLPRAGVTYVGPVEGHDIALGSRADVIVTDGFTGNVLLKGLEGAVQWMAHQMGRAYGDPEPARAVVRSTATGDFAGGMLLGVNGVTVVGHGAGTADEICACVRLADRAARLGLVTATQRALASLAVT